jgi:beta-N-acetylhexosaminidase
MKLRPKRDNLLGMASLIATGFVVLWCLHRRDPHLLSIRAYETILLLTLAIGAALLAWRTPWRCWRILLCMVNLGVVGYVSADNFRFAQLRKVLYTNPPAATRVINTRLIVGFDTDEQAEALARHGIAGLFIARKKIQGLSFAQVRSKLSHLQELRRTTGQPPLILAADQEGGVVSRLTPPLSARPALSTFASRQDGEQLAYAYGREQGRELHELGITVNFSPVVDLLPLRPSSALDRHTKIRQRAIADDPPGGHAYCPCLCDRLTGIRCARCLETLSRLAKGA